MISLKDYAKSNCISYEAVRKQVARYKNELGEHIIMHGRQQFLDEFAVNFLDDKRKKNPVVIQTVSKDERITELEQELSEIQKKMLKREAELQMQITAAQEEAKNAYKQLSEKKELIESYESNKLLLEQKTKLEIEAAVKAAQVEAEKIKQEAVDQVKASMQEKLDLAEERHEQKLQAAVHEAEDKIYNELTVKHTENERKLQEHYLGKINEREQELKDMSFMNKVRWIFGKGN